MLENKYWKKKQKKKKKKKKKKRDVMGNVVQSLANKMPWLTEYVNDSLNKNKNYCILWYSFV